MSTAPATIADLQALQASSAADSQSIKDKMDLMIGEYDQKIGLIEQNILGLGVTMDVKLNDIQRKIQDDQMNVIDQAAKRFVEIEVRAGNTSNNMQVIHQAAKDTFEQMRQEVANTDAKIQALHDECARMFKECSDKLGATGQDIISMKEHLNDQPPRDWHGTSRQIRPSSMSRIGSTTWSTTWGQEPPQGYSTKNRGLIPEKECRPDKFDGEIGKFRRWKDDFLDFVDAQRPGLKSVLKSVSKNRLDPSDADVRRTNTAFSAVLVDEAAATELWRAIKHHTIGNARTIVETMKEEDGFEVWREIVKQCEPDLPLRKQAIMQELIVTMFFSRSWEAPHRCS